MRLAQTLTQQIAARILGTIFGLLLILAAWFFADTMLPAAHVTFVQVAAGAGLLVICTWLVSAATSWR